MNEFGEASAKSIIVSQLTRNRSVKAAQNGGVIVILSLLAYYALFRLPFRFPPGERLMSASYAFGFNNAVAIIALAGLLALVTLLHLVRGRFPAKLAITVSDVRNGKAWTAIRVVFAIACIGYAGLTFALYRYYLQSAPSLIWEPRHFLHRTWLMDIYGLRAYRDFSAEYGPLLTYTPLWTYWLIKPLGASYESAYFLCHLLLNIAGLWCIYYLFTRLELPVRKRTVAFVVIAVAGFAPYMGLNGVLVRYLCPFATLLLGHRIVGRILQWPNRVPSWSATILLVMILVSANVLLSPEVGIGFILAWLCYATLMMRRDYRVLGTSLIACLVTALLGWALLPDSYYSSVIRFSQGANNLPLVPAAHLVFYFITMFLVVPPLLAIGITKSKGIDAAHGAICGALGALCLVMAPGALGRCDPPHVLFYGMGASILTMIGLANVSRRGFMLYVFGYAAVFIILLEIINLRVFYGVSPRELLSWDAVTHLRDAFHRAAGTEHPSPDLLAKLNKYPELDLPFATFGDPAFEKYVVLRGQLHPEYYMAIVGAYHQAALQRKLSDVRKAKYLLVPQGLAAESGSNPCKDYLVSLRRWFFYPAKLPCRAEPLEPTAAVRSFISKHYIEHERIDHWSVLRRIDNSLRD
jgi:hypothetical protein